MTYKPAFPPIRIRVGSGELAGQWLESLGVSEGGVRVLPIIMGSVLKQSTRFTFHPLFTRDERAAYKLCGLGTVDGYVRVLGSMGIDAEIVIGTAPDVTGEFTGPDPVRLN